MPHYKDSQNKLYFLSPDDVAAGGVPLLPSDCVEVPEEQAEAIREANKPQPTAEQLQARFAYAIQLRLDTFAQTRNYDNILSACTYATSAVAKFKAEGQACVNLRDATWAAAYQILADVQTGDRPMPTSIADIEADLPAVVWPK